MSLDNQGKEMNFICQKLHLLWAFSKMLPLQTLLMLAVYELDFDLSGRCGPFPAALQALQQSAVKELLRNMITAIYPISDGLQAFEKAKSKGSLKVLLDMKG